jgi:hypothetical protein
VQPYIEATTGDWARFTAATGHVTDAERFNQSFVFDLLAGSGRGGVRRRGEGSELKPFCPCKPTFHVVFTPLHHIIDYILLLLLRLSLKRLTHFCVYALPPLTVCP